MNTEGVEFFYMEEGAKSWQYKKANIQKANDNPLHKTLQQVYSGVGIHRIVLWNETIILLPLETEILRDFIRRLAVWVRKVWLQDHETVFDVSQNLFIG